MRSRTRILCLCLSFVALTGCATSPPPAEDGLASAYSVGDRARAAFDEVVVSLRMRETDAPYQNLHVVVTAFVNPVRQTPGSPDEARGIVQRAEPRIAAALSRSLGQQHDRSVADSEHLRELARTEAQAVADAAMKQWEYGADYHVEIAVTSLYWTDASVGPPPPRRGLW